VNTITETFDIIAADGSSWIAEALCGHPESNPDWWFPGPSEPLKAALAIRICRRCPVRRQCLQDALERGDKRGIRGGVTANRRTRMLRKRDA